MMTSWIEQLRDARRVNQAGVILTANTQDRVFSSDPNLPSSSLLYFLARLLIREGYTVAVFSLGGGLRELVPGEAPRQPATQTPFGGITCDGDPVRVLQAVIALFRRREPRLALIVDHADHVAPNSGGMSAALSPTQSACVELLHAMGQDDSIRAAGHFVTLVSHDGGLHPLIAQGGHFRSISIDLPDLDTRLGFTRLLQAAAERGNTALATQFSQDLALEEFVRITGGLRLLDIEEVFRWSAACGQPISRTDVRNTKARAIASLCRGLIEVIDPGRGFDGVAGADRAKDYFRALKDLWRKGAKSMPQAILLAGVPGCGKSHIVQALAGELQCPTLVMRGIREAWVGASERNLERALWVTENLAPCILWTDEIDQALGQRSGGPSTDSGTSERMLARMFEFFGSMRHRGRILWVATTNRPDLLDPALLDRFQVVIPFLHPTARERAQLLPLLARQVGRSLAADVNCEALAARPQLDGLTVRSLQEIVASAGMRADVDSGDNTDVVDARYLDQSLGDYLATQDRLHHELMALTAIEATSFASLLPWMDVSGKRPVLRWPSYLDGLVDEESGRPRADAVAGRIRELQGILRTTR